MLLTLLLTSTGLAGGPAIEAAPSAEPAGPATTAAALPPRLTCRGTEPFWSITLSGGKASAASPDRPSAPDVSYSTTATTHGDAFLVSPKGKGPGFRWLTIAAGACSDGMSEQAYTYRALALTSEQGFVSGCCAVPD